VDGLSNWYVRRSRERFWKEEKRDKDKLDAYWTLYECLVTAAKLIAPFTPFLAEAIWRNLAGAAFGPRAVESVHLCDYPTGDPDRIDETLAERMALGREISSLGRAARTAAKIKVRQPLGKVEIVLADATHRAWLESYDAIVREELNVKEIEYLESADQYVAYTVLPELKRLGPRLGKRLPAVKQALGNADAAKLLAELRAKGHVVLALADGDVLIDENDVQIRMQARPGWTAAQGPRCVVVLSTELSADLIREGIAREVVRAVQDRRKELGLRYTDRIAVGVVSESAELRSALAEHSDYIRAETLAVALVPEPVPGAESVPTVIADQAAALYVAVAVAT
jgi:isoleucyl-tRNA synthetase